MQKVKEAAQAILNWAKKGSFFLIISHFDADGLASAGIIGKALARLDVPFHLRIVDHLDEELLEEIKNTEHDVLIFTEIGSGYLDLIQGKLGDRSEIIVIDHHQPLLKAPSKIVHLNPHLYGFDGSREIAGSGVVYLVVKEIDNKNVDLSILAIVGALGDMQDKCDKRSLCGLNDLIAQEGVREGYLKISVDLIFYGRETRPLHKALAYTTNPFLPGLSGEEDKCLALLTSSGINLKNGERWRTISDLSLEEKQSLLAKIIEFSSASGFPGKKALDLVGTVYTLEKEEETIPTRDAREYASVLNACGRMNKTGLAVSLCLGDRTSSLQEAQQVLTDYRKTLAKYIRFLAENPSYVQEMERIYAVRGEDWLDENMTGALASMLSSSGIANEDKVMLVLAKSKESLMKISARANEAMLSKGLNLGEVLQGLVKNYEGVGGGHDIAAGANIPIEFIDKFLEDLNSSLRKILGDQNV
ncbi:MAG: DHH family phosphoesterase [Candidatus Bathyarchaeia archaeon]